MSVVVDHEREDHQLICKGAVEEILAVCTLRARRASARSVRRRRRPRGGAPRGRPRAGRRDERGRVPRRGRRVPRLFPTTHGPYTVADESELILAGFIGFLDPPKETAAPALKALAAHGITVKILTGDNDLVTRKICRDVGLDVDHIVLGSELAGPWTTPPSARSPSEHTVFAKLTPDDKTRIVRALRARGHTVGFLGDGINDAGALREADVGISVDSAVDIAKESADIILLEKSLMVLEEGVVEGRRTFGNTIKYIKMTASSNFGNVFSVLIASAFLPFLPMLPIQLLTVNLLYDFSQTAIPWDDMDPEYLRVPRQWRADDIGRFMIFIGPISSIFDIVTFLVMWYVFGANAPARQALFQSGWFIESLPTQTLIVHMIRTAKLPVRPEPRDAAGAVHHRRDHRRRSRVAVHPARRKTGTRTAAGELLRLARRDSAVVFGAHADREGLVHPALRVLALRLETMARAAVGLAAAPLLVGAQSMRDQCAGPSARLLGVQSTFIGQAMPGFSAAYSSTMSLESGGDHQLSQSYGAYGGACLVKHLAVYVDAEMIRGSGISHASGLAAVTNGDVLRQGSVDLGSGPYVARAFARWTIPLASASRDTVASRP